ncbi:MAG: outer membrane beta-barrel protein [Acidobacteriaceae bacterium]
MRILFRHLVFAALCVFLAGFAVPSHAQNFLHNSEASVSGFAQFTPSVTGNGVTVDTTRSAGGQAAFRHSYHWWMGFEGSYNYTRFSEHYSAARPYAVQHNMHEFAASYLVSGASVLGFRPFALGGVSAVVFSPSLNGGQRVAWQARPGVNFGVGIDRALFTSHFGVRLQYRGVYYKTPDFGEPQLQSNKYRLTSEPMAGLYLRF